MQIILCVSPRSHILLRMTDAAQQQRMPVWTLGDHLRKARLHASIGSTGDMADRLGVHRNSVINYESDRIKPPLDVVVRWARITHLPLDWFLEDYDPGETSVTMRYPILWAEAA